METMDRDGNIDLEKRLHRSRGRSGRTRVASAKVTSGEQRELEAAAGAAGKALSEWARDTLLEEARRSKDDALFTEIIATRMLLVNLLKPLLMGQKVTPERLTEIMATVRTEKRKAAQEVMQQYTTND